jgi:hypothetical protein
VHKPEKAVNDTSFLRVSQKLENEQFRKLIQHDDR